MDPIALVSVWAGAFLGTAAGVFALERWAHRNDVFDVPNERSMHETPTPRGGGLAIVVCAVLGGAVSLYLLRPMPVPWSLAVGVPFIAAVGWLDDLRGLSNRLRFACQTAAGVLVLGEFGFWTEAGWQGGGTLPLGLAGAPLALLWIVGLSNAYNFMDGIDGIAAGQGLVAAVGWAVVGWLVGLPWVMALGGAVAAACAGFLLFNWSPARIFMGDVGSVTLGFLFASLPLILAAQSPPDAGVAPFVGLLFVWPFVFDTVYTILRRARARENVFQAHRSHLFQRLTQAGWSHRQVSMLYIALAGCGLPAAWAWARGPLWLGVLAVLAVVGLAWGLVQGVRRAEAAA